MRGIKHTNKCTQPKKGVPQDKAHLSLTYILSNLKQKTYLESVNSKAVRLHLNVQHIAVHLSI